MANVPDYNRQVQLRGSNQQSISVGTSAATFGGQVGQAAQTLGAGVAKIADAIDYRDQLTADADARKAFNAYRYDQREALNAPETGYLNQTGGNALDVQKSAEARLTELRDKHGDGLDPRALKKYQALTDEMQDQAHSSLLTHTADETRNYVVNERKSTINGYIEEAATNWNNQELFDRNLGNALREQDQLATLQGWDAATRVTSAEALISGAVRQRIVYAAEKDPVAAQKMLDQSRDTLSAEDEYALSTGLKGVVMDARVDAFTQQFIRRGGTTPSAQSGQRKTARYDATDNPNDGVKVDFAMGNARPEKPNQEVIDVVTTAAEATFGKGTRVVVTSGAEGNKAQHGSGRHQTGMAGDVAIIRPDGTTVKATDTDAAQFARAAASAGALGLGFGEGYMGGDHFHVDLVVPSGGQAHTWGKQGAAMGPELTALMTKGASATLQGTPYEDNAVNRGLVSQFGARVATTMIGAAEATPFIPAKTALPPEIMAANPNFEGMTIGEVYDAISSAVGDDPAARMGRAHFDAQAAYEAALAISDPEMRKAALQSIDTMATLQDRGRAEARREAQENAWNEYTSTGRTDFPMDVRQSMGQSGWTAFQSAVANDRKGIDTSNPETWEMLTRMASSNPKKFADLNLPAHYPNLSKADREQFIQTQESVRSALAGNAKKIADGANTINYDKVFTAADDVYAALVDS